MPCPFLNKLSSNYVKNYGHMLLRMYGNQCPVLPKGIVAQTGEPVNSTGKGDFVTKKTIYVFITLPLAKPDTSCPFLMKVNNVVKEVKNDYSIEMKNEEKVQCKLY